MAQWVQQLLSTPENRGSNPVNRRFYLLSTVSKRQNLKEWTKFKKYPNGRSFARNPLPTYLPIYLPTNVPIYLGSKLIFEQGFRDVIFRSMTS